VNLIGFLQDKFTNFIKQPCFLCGSYDKLAICKTCENSLNSKNTLRCESCGLPLQKTKLKYCFDCLKNPNNFNKTYVLYDYSSWVRILIHNFKYQQKLFIGKFFAKKITQFIANNLNHNLTNNLTNYDAIIPMPLHKNRLKERGFNQVMELLQDIKKIKNIKIDNKSCVRFKATKELNKLGLKERNKEIKNAFKVIKNMNYNKILLVDDIMTTTISTTELTKTILKYYKDNKKTTPQIDVLVLSRSDKN
jgi:ComF family protein